jgi:hypothetical protein
MSDHGNGVSCARASSCSPSRCSSSRAVPHRSLGPVATGSADPPSRSRAAHAPLTAWRHAQGTLGWGLLAGTSCAARRRVVRAVRRTAAAARDAATWSAERGRPAARVRATAAPARPAAVTSCAARPSRARAARAIAVPARQPAPPRPAAAVAVREVPVARATTTSPAGRRAWRASTAASEGSVSMVPATSTRSRSGRS